MSAQIAAHGRLGRDPETRQTKNDKTMATTSLAVDVTGYGAAEQQQETLWLGICAFGRVADDLTKCRKGDMVSISGRLTMNRWIGKDGAEKEQLQVTVDSVVSAKTVRPGGRRKGNDGTRKYTPGYGGDPNPEPPPWL